MSAIRPFLYRQLLSYILYKLWKNVAYRSEIKSRVLVCSPSPRAVPPLWCSSLLPLAALLGVVSRVLSAICSSVPHLWLGGKPSASPLGSRRVPSLRRGIQGVVGKQPALTAQGSLRVQLSVTSHLVEGRAAVLCLDCCSFYSSDHFLKLSL